MRTLGTIPTSWEQRVLGTRSSARRPPGPKCRKLVGPFGTFQRLGAMRSNPRSGALAPRPAMSNRATRAIHQIRAVEPAADRVFTRQDLLTANDIAEILQIKRSTALDYMRRGVIPACKIGRRWYALRSQIDDYIGELFGQR